MKKVCGLLSIFLFVTLFVAGKAGFCADKTEELLQKIEQAKQELIKQDPSWEEKFRKMEEENAKRQGDLSLEDLSPKKLMQDMNVSFAEMSEHIDEAILECEQKLAWEPKNADGYYTLGVLYRMKYDYSNPPDKDLLNMSDDNFQKALELNPALKEKTEQARLAFKTENTHTFAESIDEELKKSVAFSENIKKGRECLEIAEQNNDESYCDKAIESLYKAMEIKKDDIIFLLLGDAYKLKFIITGGKNNFLLNKAVENWQKVENISSVIIEDNIEQAKSFFKKKDEELERSYRFVKHDFYDLQYEKEKKINAQELVDRVKNLIAQSPEYIEAYLLLGDIYAYQGKKDEAINAYNDGLEKEPENTKFFLAIGDVYLNEEKYKEAKQYYEKIPKKDPLNEIAKKRIEIVDSALKRNEEMLEFIRKDLDWHEQYAPQDNSEEKFSE